MYLALLCVILAVCIAAVIYCALAPEKDAT